MICVAYGVKPSLIPHAGSGLFLSEAVKKGKVLIAPSHINKTVGLAEILEHPNHPDADSSIRWFEDVCTTSPDWPDECYVNHAFTPTGLWHLGFIFALEDLPAGTEITVDYRHLLGPGVMMPFTDSVTGNAIVGFTWQESLLFSTQQLLALAHTEVAATFS